MMRATARIHLALLLGGCPAALVAQAASTGTIEGRIVDSAGAAVGLAAVRVDRADRGFVRDAVSDGQGRFRIGFLVPGEFRVSVRRIGYREVVLERVGVEAGSVTRLSIRLDPVARTLDSLVSTAPAVTIDRDGTEFGTAIGARELRRLPLPNEARDLVRFANGARPDQVWGGATAQANNYQLDGVAVNHPGIGGDLLQPSVTWIEEVQVRGLGAGAEHGNFQGGIVNIVTRSGQNRREGAVRFAAETHRLNASNLVPGEAGSEVSDRLEFDGQLLGPLVRDRLFYALFGQVVRRDVRVLDQFPDAVGDFVAAPPRERQGRFLGKLTWVPTSRDNLSLSVARFDTRVDRFGQTGFKRAEATQRLDAGSWLGTLAWQRTWSARSFLEVKVSGYDGHDDRLPHRSSDVPALQVLNQVDPLEYQNAVFSERRAPRTAALSATWDRYARFLGGDHHLKVGFELAASSWAFHRSRNGGLTWRPGLRTSAPAFDPADPSTWLFNGALASTWGGEIALDAKTDVGAVFLQDQFRIGSRLTISPGLRWSRWTGRLGGVRGNFADVVRPTGFDPRLGATLALAGDGTLSLKAHWGRYHQSLFAGFFDRSAGSNVYRDEERWEYTGAPFGDPTTTLTTAQRAALAAQGLFRRVELNRLSETGVATDYRQPYVDQTVLGLEKTFGDHWKAEAVYVHRNNRNMVALVDRNLADNYTVFANVGVLDRFFNPLYLNGKPLRLSRLAVSNEDILYWYALLQAGVVQGAEFLPPGMTAAQVAALQYRPDLILTNAPDARRRFDQLQVRVQARYPTWWFDVGGTITALEGNLNTVVGPDDYGGSSAGPYVRLNESFDALGNLANQSRLELKVRAGGDLPLGFRGAGFLEYASGDYYTPTLTLSNLLFEFEADLPATIPRLRRLRSYFFQTTAGQRLFVQPRGAYQYPARATVDLRLERGLTLGRSQLLFTLDAFNVLGATTITEVQTSFNGETDPFATGRLGAVRNRLPPRTIRLGTTLEW